MPLADPNDLWPELEQLGEAEVRRKLLLNAYGHTKLPTVHAWLQTKVAAREAATAEQQDSFRRDELRILRSTKNAAWVAAIAALLSMIAAGVAVWSSSH